MKEDQTEVILDISGEGGGLTIFGRKRKGDSWLFKVEGVSLMVGGDDDEESWEKSEMGEADSIEKALSFLGQDWPSHSPGKIHPQFREQVWKAVQVRMKDYQIPEGFPSPLPRWKEACGIDQVGKTAENDEPASTKPKIPLSYGDPLKAVLLRKLAWETYVAKPVERLRTRLKVKDITGELINSARADLGFRPVSRGPSSDFYNKALKNVFIEDDPNLKPVQDKWKTTWRLLNLPSHFFVRYLSDAPIICEEEKNDGFIEYTVALPDPALPRLKVFVGRNKPPGDVFGERRGVYFLCLPKHFYVGKSDEFDVRLGQHLRGKYREALWWVFVSPEKDDKTFTLDALGAAESLMISFWNELCLLANDKAGADKEPAFAYLQQAILFVAAASATLIWLIRENPTKDLAMNLDDCRSLFIRPSLSGGKDWPNCYLAPPARAIEDSSATI